VRKVKLAVGDATLDNKGCRVKHVSYFEQPVQKLVLLVPSNDTEDSNRGWCIKGTRVDSSVPSMHHDPSE